MVETPPDASGPATVRSVDRALDLLEVLELSEGPVRLVELSRGSGLGNATVLRILGSLQQRGLVTVENGEYRLGAATLGMANGYLTTDTLSNRARPVLQQLAETTRLTASLYVRVGDARVLAVRVDGENPLRYQLPLGRRLPLNVGAGKVILAALTPDEIERNLDRLGDTTTARGERVTGDDLRDQLTGIRSAGFHISIDERAIGASSVSAPVFDRRGTVTGAITASGPSETITSAELEAWTPELRRAARAVEH